MSRAPVVPKLKPSQVTQLKSMGFTHVCIVADRGCVREPGSVEAAFRSGRDADRFAFTLNRTFGSGLYRGERL